MNRTIQRRQRQLFAIIALAALLLSPPLAAPIHACSSGTSGGAGHCGG